MRQTKRFSMVMALLLAATSPGAVKAQGYFGQNQVQYDNFRWRVLETEHFAVHYYPEEREAAVDAARMAERAYARLSRILGHQFREKKPLVLFSSRGDFGQNNVTGDLGEGTGGVTEALRHRMLVPFTGDYKSFEHVLTHEMVHEFQYDIFARGKAGNGLQTLAQVDPPLWFAEGMAEYLSIGPDHPLTSTWIRDAALNGRLPTIDQMTNRPDLFFPYRYGMALWAYVGSRWGDESIGEIMNNSPSMGIARAFKQETGLSLDELSDEWRDAMQVQHLPPIAHLDRARKFAQPLLTQRRSGGEIFLAPSLSNDGKRIVFLSNGNFYRGEVFIDLWLGDATTGKRIKRLVKSTTNPNFEELRLLYSQSAFSPDGKLLAFTAMRNGKDVLYLLDVERRKTVKRFDLPLEGITSPTWSPDEKQIAFSGNNGGITDLYVVDTTGANLRRLTNDRYGDMQPQWSPDGNTIAYASDRGPGTNFETLRLSKWRITLLHLQTGEIETVPGQDGLNLNPMWAPDGQSIAYVSDRSGIANVFLYDLGNKQHYQLTNVIGAVSAITEYSPAISWARQADRLAFTYFENGDFTVWSVDNPRLLRKSPYQPSTQGYPTVIAARPEAERVDRRITPAGAPLDSASGPQYQRSYYRAPSGLRPSDELPTSASGADTTVVSVSALLDSAALALPDTTKFRDVAYHVGYQPEYVARPSIGYAQDNFGKGVYGGTTIILSDLLGNNRLAFAAQINGRVQEALLYSAYTNLGRRLQYSTGLYQVPLFLVTDARIQDVGGGRQVYTQELTRLMQRQIFAVGLYPLNRFTRVELGLTFTNLDQSTLNVSQIIDPSGFVSQPFYNGSSNLPGIDYLSPQAAYVSDNTLFGATGPIMGRRYRFQVQPVIGTVRWMEYHADYRRYDPIIFNFLTVATRLETSVSVGPDETKFPKYIGRPEYIRGYDRENYSSAVCSLAVTGASASCAAKQLLGSRVALANAELRFPLIRRFDLGLLPIQLPPLDGLVFYDAGMAWTAGQSVSLRRPENYNFDTQRYPLRSYGFGLRLNVFNFAILRWDYAIPKDMPGRKGFWTFAIGPSY
jgi:WD40 repeat protein